MAWGRAEVCVICVYLWTFLTAPDVRDTSGGALDNYEYLYFSRYVPMLIHARLGERTNTGAENVSLNAGVCSAAARLIHPNYSSSCSDSLAVSPISIRSKTGFCSGAGPSVGKADSDCCSTASLNGLPASRFAADVLGIGLP